MKKKFTKGQTVYLMTLPLSNAARYYGENAILTGEVKSVGPKYITVQIDSWRTVRFSAETLRDTDERSESYTLHLTREDAEKTAKLREMRRRLAADECSFSFLQRLTDDKVEKIYNIVYDTPQEKTEK